MFVIKSQRIGLKQEDLYNKQLSIGNYYSVDRFYTILNGYIDLNLSHKSRILAAIIKFLFKSSNYKHDATIANGKSIGIILLDIFCILCLIGFFAMIIAVIGTSLTIPSDLSGFAKFTEGFIKSLGGNIAMLVFATIFAIISLLWLIMFFTIRRKNKKLALKDYVTKKIEFILKLSWLIKLSGKIKKAILDEKDVEIHYINKFESQGGCGDRWLNLQLINLLSSIFNDFNLVFVFNILTEDEVKEMNEIIACDFKRIELKEYQDEVSTDQQQKQE